MAISAMTVVSRPFVKGAVDNALLQTWSRDLDASTGKDTPVTRVVGLLKNMAKQLDDDMDKDEAQYKELSCWCNNNNYEKTEANKASTAKIQELESNIEQYTASVAELAKTIEDLENDVAADKKALAEATALREKQLAEFHGMEKDSIQALENLRAAITVLGKHFGEGAEPKSTVAGGQVFKSEKDRWSLLAIGSKEFPWASSAAQDARSLDNFMRKNGFDEDFSGVTSSTEQKPISQHGFLQQHNAEAASSSSSASSSVSDHDEMIIKRALRSASAFVQAHQGLGYVPAYTSQSGEIFGILKQLEEEMSGELSEAQKREQERAAVFVELRSAKETEIANNEKMAEQKEDEHANTRNLLAEAKEDLDVENNALDENTKFLNNLKETCDEANKNFETRKAARMEEMKAVGETIEILQADEARDAMSGTFKSFVQLQSTRDSTSRRKAAEKLRSAAKRTHSPQLSVLATSVELDAFVKVKQAIDDMVSMLKQQQEDEVKKNDWCKAEIQDNEMSTAKSQDRKASLEAKIAELESNIKAHGENIENAKAQIAQQQLDLQRATEDRQKENVEFQRTIKDQMTTIVVLKKALDRLATFYDFSQVRASLLQTSKQTPPVAQAEYSANKGATGVMEMIEKLVYDSQDLMKDARKSESEAQAAYETTVADTNGSVAALQKEVVTQTKAKAQAEKDRLNTESDHSDTVKEIEGLQKYNGDLHQECDYLLKNFNLRQSSRQDEVEALQQAKQILSGAASS